MSNTPTKLLNAHAGALDMASRGFRVFPLQPNSKDPFVKDAGDDPALCGGINLGTTNVPTIERWFERNPAINYGVCATGFVVLDLDIRGGDESWVGHWLDLGPLPATLAVATPSGGSHTYLTGCEAGQRDIVPGIIQVRARGGYVVGPGSSIDGKSWRITNDAPVAMVPAELAARLSKPGEKAADNSTPLCELDTDAAIAWGRSYLEQAPGADEGRRNATLNRLACDLKDGGLSKDAARELLVEVWCPKCSPPYDEGDNIAKTVASSRNSKGAPGCNAPAAHFEDVSAAPELAEWDRRRLGVPEGALTEGSADIDIDEIVKWRVNALVKGILHPGEQAVLYADPGAGKSFAALDLAWHVAQGKPWHGRKVAKVPVLYCALEGVEGFRGRIKAAEITHGKAPWFRRQKAHVSLIRDKVGEQGMATVLAAVKETAALCGAPVGLIVIDTLARAMAGDDENSAKDVMHFVDHRAGEIARKTGAAVLTVAHTNKLGTLRGSLTLSGAVNVVLKIERDGDSRTLVGEKIKDGDEVALFGFTLRKVHLATDSDGDAVQSCVIDATPADPAAKLGKEGRGQRVFREAYRTACELAGKAVVPLSDIRDAFRDNYPADGESDPEKLKETVRRAWGRVCKALPSGLRVRKIDGMEHVGPKGATDITEEFSAIDSEES